MKRNRLLAHLNKTFRKLNALNLLLITTLSGLVYYSYDILSSPYDPEPQNSFRQETYESKKPNHLRPQSPDFASFNTVPANNLFRPERSEYVKPGVIAVPPPPPPPPKPERRLPKPNLTLDGVLLSDTNDKTAMISGNYFTSRSRVNIRQQRYKEGDTLGNYKIVEIARMEVILMDKKSNEKLTLSLKFSGYNTALAQRRNRVNKGVRPAIPGQVQRVRAARNVPVSQRIPSPPVLNPERHGRANTGAKGRGVQRIPAVYSGGRVYYPEHGSPPPQRISGDLSPVGQQPPPGN